jgi:hypothetical protein
MELKCEYCRSILITKSNRESHMKRNKSCLKLRELSFMTFKDKQIIYVLLVVLQLFLIMV